MPAIWPEPDGHVTRIVIDESQLSQSELEGATIVSTIPDANPGPGETPTLYYSDADGCYYQYTNHIDELPSVISSTDREAIYNAVLNADYPAVASILRNYL